MPLAGAYAKRINEFANERMILTCPNCATQYEVDGAQFAAKAKMVEGVRARLVRCQSCGTKWYQQVDDEEDALDLATEVAPPAPPPPSDSLLMVEPEPEIALADVEPEPEPAPAPAPEPAPRVEIEPPVVVAPKPAPEKPSRPAPPPPPPRPIRDEEPRRRGWIWGTVAWTFLFLVAGGASFAGHFYRADIVDALPPAKRIYALLNIEVPSKARGLEFEGVSYAIMEEDKLPVLQVTGAVVNLADKEMAIPKIRIALRDAQQREIYTWTVGADSVKLAPGASAPFKTRLSSPPAEAYDLKVRFIQPGETS